MDESSDILVLLRKQHGSIDLSGFIAPRLRGVGLYEFIVGVMLSQNTSDRNAIRAYNNLKKLLNKISPEKVLETSIEEIIKAIKPAGMYLSRSKRIVELAKLFNKPGFEEELINKIEKLDPEEARKLLVSLPGIGYKTADVVLLMYFGKPSFPVDTHIARITRRLGFVEKNNYEEIRRFWMKVFDPSDYLEAHLLLITHGRRICRARNPLCNICLLKNICKYYLENK